MKTAFTKVEIKAIKETTVTTADNKWSGEADGNDTDDKLYLLSIEEMMETSYGFSSDEREQDTRKITAAAQVAYAKKSSMKGQKTKPFKGTSVTVKSLKKTYYFRVRAYTKKNGKTVYGN